MASTASGADPTRPRDEYEKAFLEALAQKSPTAKPVVDDALRLFDRVAPAHRGPIRQA